MRNTMHERLNDKHISIYTAKIAEHIKLYTATILTQRREPDELKEAKSLELKDAHTMPQTVM